MSGWMLVVLVWYAAASIATAAVVFVLLVSREEYEPQYLDGLGVAVCSLLAALLWPLVLALLVLALIGKTVGASVWRARHPLPLDEP